MVRRHRTGLSEQQILNFALDDESINPPTSMRGALEYADGGGWVRKPYNNSPPRVECEYSGNNLVYEGHNLSSSAATTATDWIVTKSIYDASGNFLRSQTLIGSWTGRAAISWTIS